MINLFLVLIDLCDFVLKLTFFYFRLQCYYICKLLEFKTFLNLLSAIYIKHCYLVYIELDICCYILTLYIALMFFINSSCLRTIFYPFSA